MAAQETIETLSGVLMSDERILNVAERELLTNLIQRAKQDVRPENKNVPGTIARMVGALVAERTHGILENSISERVLREWVGPTNGRTASTMRLGSPPPGLPPGPSPNAPRPPGPSPQMRAIGQLENMANAATLAEKASILPAQCVLLDEFLAPEELQEIMQDTLAREMEFQISEVIAPGVAGGITDFEHRRSHVLMDLGKRLDALLARLQGCLPRVLWKLGQNAFQTSRVEMQITASNDGDFFRCHSDNAEQAIASREITFVYFFHREPKHFRGGELRIYDSRWENGIYVPTQNYRAIVPQQNQVVLFASSLAHEITPVECPSKAFADSRFTVNGWFHR